MAELVNEIKMDESLLQLMDRGADAKPFVSIEFFPPKTEAGVTSLYNCLEKLKKVNPLFADVTWGAGGSTSGTCKSPLTAQRESQSLLEVRLLTLSPSPGSLHSLFILYLFMSTLYKPRSHSDPV
jgi:hypothetical protein